MRRIAVVLSLLTVTAGLAFAGTSLGSNAQRTRVSCGAKSLTFLFWPDGHNAIPSIGFPSFPYPHMEVYKTAAGAYPDTSEVAIVEFTPSGQPASGFAKTCKTVRAKLLNSKPLRAKTSQATELTCTFPQPAQLDVVKSNSPTAITLRASVSSKATTAKLEVSARFMDAPGASTLRFDPKRCKAFPPPQ